MYSKKMFAVLVFSLVLGSTTVFAKEKKAASVGGEDYIGSSESGMDSADRNLRRNAMSLELLGRGGIYSVNYDYSFSKQLAIGAGVALYSSGSASVGAFPVYASYYLGENANRLMFTGGPTLVTASASIDSGSVKGSGLAGAIGIGYEYRGDSGFLFRAVPYLNFGAISGPWLGVSGGYTF